MVSICLYFQVHQPYRIKKFSFFDIGKSANYFDDEKNKAICAKVSNKCYLPTNHILLSLIRDLKDKFKIVFSISGVALEQFEECAPLVLESFKTLAKTGLVEFLSETYYHSLAFLYSKDEFKRQVEQHKGALLKHFNAKPTIFRNTELVYNNELASHIEQMGFEGIITEGADHILEWRSPNFVYSPVNCSNIKLLLKNYRLSDDIAFRFSDKGWSEWPLTPTKFAQWVNALNGNADVVNLYMDYETFGEHQWKESGIFEFLKQFPTEVLKNSCNSFSFPSEVIKKYPVRGALDIHNYISWADIERDLTAWLGNKMQQDAITNLYALENAVIKTNNPELTRAWRLLQTSDHFYYMCTKWFNDGDVHKYFNPYDSPYEAFISFMNVITDMKERIEST